MSEYALFQLAIHSFSYLEGNNEANNEEEVEEAPLTEEELFRRVV